MKALFKNSPNVLSVAVRVLIIALLFGGTLLIAQSVGIANFQLWHKILCGAMLLFALVVLGQLVFWGFSWVRNERVSELGLHIVRFAVILFAVALSLFIMLSVDYTNQYRDTLNNELQQQALAGRVYVQNSIGDRLGSDAAYYDALAGKVSTMLDQNDSNSDRHVVLYLREQFAHGAAGSAFVPYGEEGSGLLAYSSSETAPPAVDTDVIWSVIRSGEVSSSDYAAEVSVSDVTAALATAQAPRYRAAFTPVFTKDGMPVGVLELSEQQPAATSVFSFASLELFLIVAAAICMFSFLFYGVMQLVDISLRPRKHDKSRKVLTCGREAVRPILFFVTLTASLPVMMFYYSPNIRDMVSIGKLSERICDILPIIVFMLGIALGLFLSRPNRAKLTELPSNAALALSALCNIGLILILDWNKTAGNTMLRNWLVVFILIFISGIGYGISYRTISKFQAQSDALFGTDKYAYLCSCLGAISGIILGAMLLDISGDLTVRIILLILSVITCVLSVIFLEDLSNTVDTKKSHIDQLDNFDGAILCICAIGIAVCFDWVYLSAYFFIRGYAIVTLAFCICAPIIAFCFGNRLRLRSDKSRRTALIAGSVIAALSFLPMIIAPSELMAFVSCMIVCIAVVFCSAGLYSSMKHKEERTTCIAKVRPLLFVGIFLFALIINLPTSRIFLLVAAVLALAAGLGIILTKFPERPGKPNVSTYVHDASAFAAAVAPAIEPVAAIEDTIYSYTEPEPYTKPEPIVAEEEKPDFSAESPADDTASVEEEAPPVVVADDSSEDSVTAPADDTPTADDADKPKDSTDVSPFDTPHPPSVRSFHGGLSLEDLSSLDSLPDDEELPPVVL